jgi:hypothetical protein
VETALLKGSGSRAMVENIYRTMVLETKAISPDNSWGQKSRSTQIPIFCG